MVKPPIVGVVGDTNVGKTTLFNTIMGKKVLSSNYVSETALLVWLAPRQVDGEPVAVFGDGSSVRGARPIQTRIKDRNAEIRAELDDDTVGSARPAAEAVCLECDLIPSLRELQPGPEGRPKIKLVDMPGANEIGNSHMRQCAEDAFTNSDAVIVLIRYDQITARATEDLFKHIMENAPFHFTNTDHIEHFVIGITHVDSCRSDDDGAAEVSAKVKATLRSTLAKMECLKDFRRFAASVPIVAINAQSAYDISGMALYDWLVLETHLKHIVAAAPALIRGRQLRASHVLKDALGVMFACNNVGQVYPEHARSVLGQAVKKMEEAEFYATLAKCGVATLGLVCAGGCVAYLTLYGTVMVVIPAVAGHSAIAGSSAIAASPAVAAGWWGLGNIITIPMIGLTAASPALPAVAAVAAVPAVPLVAAISTWGLTTSGYVAAAAGVVALGSSALSPVVISAPGMRALLDETLAGDVGVMSQHDALQAAEASFPTTEQEILAGYRDVLRYSSQDGSMGSPLYIGAWKGNQPHGEGQIFWPNGVAAFKGEMRDGMMWKGFLIDERNRVQGQFKFRDDADMPNLEFDGFQPGEEDDEGQCVACMDGFCMAAESCEVFKACYHGNVCRSCAQHLPRGECPTCCAVVTVDGEVQTLKI